MSSPAISVSFASAIAVQTNYNLGNLCPAANPGNGTPTVTDPTALPSVMSKPGSSYNYKIYSTKWNVKNLYPNLFPTETNGQPPGVCLIASANLILTGSTVISNSASIRSGTATLTHGKNPAGYTPASGASPRPTPTVSPTPTPGYSSTAGPTAAPNLTPLPSASPTIGIDTPLPTPTAAAPPTPTTIPPTPTAIPTASPLPTTASPQPTPTVPVSPTASATTAASSRAGPLPNPFAGLI